LGRPVDIFREKAESVISKQIYKSVTLAGGGRTKRDVKDSDIGKAMLPGRWANGDSKSKEPLGKSLDPAGKEQGASACHKKVAGCGFWGSPFIVVFMWRKVKNTGSKQRPGIMAGIKR